MDRQLARYHSFLHDDPVNRKKNIGLVNDFFLSKEKADTVENFILFFLFFGTLNQNGFFLLSLYTVYVVAFDDISFFFLAKYTNDYISDCTVAFPFLFTDRRCCFI